MKSDDVDVSSIPEERKRLCSDFNGLVFCVSQVTELWSEMSAHAVN